MPDLPNRTGSSDEEFKQRLESALLDCARRLKHEMMREAGIVDIIMDWAEGAAKRKGNDA